jgi:hypothetical protein
LKNYLRCQYGVNNGLACLADIFQRPVKGKRSKPLCKTLLPRRYSLDAPMIERLAGEPGACAQV